MNYFDPARPLLANGNRMYCDAQGNGIAALPSLDVELTDSETAIVTAWLMIARATARQFSFSTCIGGVGLLLTEYCNDPEAFLKLRFGYSGPEAEAPDASASTSAEELGL